MTNKEIRIANAKSDLKGIYNESRKTLAGRLADSVKALYLAEAGYQSVETELDRAIYSTLFQNFSEMLDPEEEFVERDCRFEELRQLMTGEHKAKSLLIGCGWMFCDGCGEIACPSEEDDAVLYEAAHKYDDCLCTACTHDARLADDPDLAEEVAHGTYVNYLIDMARGK